MMRRPQTYVVDLNGELTLCESNALKPLSSWSALEGACLVLSDLDGAISRTATIEADPRYVELMLSRKLQEAGEFDEPVTVIPHWKKRRGRNTTDIFYTALPSKRYYQYLELVSEHKDNFMLFPLQSVLMTIINAYGKHRPVAAVIQHGRFADVLIGSRKKIWFADRVVAYDSGEEQINTLWETVRADIDAASKENHQDISRLYVATWVDSGVLPQWSDEDGLEVIELPEQWMNQNGTQVKTSLPVMIQKTPVRQAIAKAKDKLYYCASRFLPVMNAAIVVCALGLAVAGIWYEHQSKEWTAEIDRGRQESETVKAMAPIAVTAVAYKPTLAFIEQLWNSRQLPTYGQILSDLGQGMQPALLLESIKADYTDDQVIVKVFGKANAPFEVAHKAYQKLQLRLRLRGYKVTEERFDTQINVSNFVLQFVKETP